MKKITAADLRVGNLVDIGGTHTIIESINNSLLCIKSDNNQYENYYGYWVSTDLCEGEKIEDIKPIPLTEECLLRFGFVLQPRKNDLNQWYYIEEGRFSMNNARGFWSHSPIYLQDVIEIEYVHQLQNLYFALTGEELTLKDAN